MDAWADGIAGLSLSLAAWKAVTLFLALALVAGGLAVLSQRSRLMMRTWLRAALVAATAVSLALLGLAYAELAHVKKEKRLAVALLVDGSASVPDSELDRARAWINQAKAVAGDAWLQTIVFSRQPEQAATDTVSWQRPADPLGTNIDRALAQTMELFPEGYTRRVVLLTDGNQTEGDLAAQAAVAASHDVAVNAVVLGTRADRDLYVESVNAPAAARPGERVKVGVVIVSNYQTTAQVNLTLGGKTILNRAAPIQPGRNVIEAETTAGNQGGAFTASVDDAEDMHPENNRLSAPLQVSAAARVALFSSRPDEDLALAEALDSARVRVQPAAAGALPAQAGGLYGFDLVILSDVDYQALSPGQQDALLTYTKEGGGGVLVIGGEKTGGLGKKDNNAPIKRMMPVAFKEKKKTEPNPVTLVLVIDKSASMARERKFAMAVQAANETIETLDEKSRVGVILFDDYPRWAIPLQKVGDDANKKRMEAELRTFGVDGGTSIYPALSEAYKALKDDQAKVRHLILLSDGISLTTFEQWGHVVEWMGSKKITISAVALGKESDQEHLKKIAQVGRGRYYFTEDFAQIPRIFLEEAKQITKTGVVEKRFQPALLKKGDLLEGLKLDSIPELTGYNPADPKPTSEVFMTADRGEPLLARWRFGLGRVTALCTDSGVSWAKAWRQWPTYPTLMSRLVQGTLADLALRNYRLEARTDDRVTNLAVDVTDQFGNFVNDLQLTAKVTGPSGEEVDLPLEQTQPGGYEGRFTAREFGTYNLRVVPEGGGLARSQGTGQVHLAPPSEFVAAQPDRALLQSAVTLGGGKLDPTPAEVFAEPETEYPKRQPLWNYLLFVALGSMAIALLLRRGPFGG
jgi:uncharacterized membrane protein